MASPIRQLFEPPSEDKPSITRVALMIWVVGLMVGWIGFGKEIGYPLVAVLGILAGVKGWQRMIERK